MGKLVEPAKDRLGKRMPTAEAPGAGAQDGTQDGVQSGARDGTQRGRRSRSMHSIARHSVVNLLAFGLSSLINLAVIGLIVGQYGLAAYGLLMLARLFLPAQLLGVFDLGLPETLTRATARDIASGKPESAVRLYLATQVVALATGILVALPLVLATAAVAGFVLDLNDADTALLVPVLIAQGLAQPLLFTGQMAESVLRGQERFGRLRTVEVAMALVFGLVALLLVHLDAGIVAIAYAFLGAEALSAAIFLWLSFAGFGAGAWRGARPDFRYLFQQRRYIGAMISKSFTSMIIMRGPSIVLVQMLGPAAVGLFEAVQRIPRFLKTVITMCNNVVLPVVARIKVESGLGEVTRLATEGPRVLFALATLATLPAICVAEPLLRLWLGTEIAQYWPWFAALCALPLIGATSGFWNAMAKVETSTLVKQTRLSWVQTAVLFAVAVPLVHPLGAAAFWLGTLASHCIGVPAQIAINARRYGVSKMHLAKPVLTVIAASLPATALGVALVLWTDLGTWPRLIAAFAAIAVVQAISLALLVLRSDERRLLLRAGLRRG